MREDEVGAVAQAKAEMDALHQYLDAAKRAVHADTLTALARRCGLAASTLTRMAAEGGPQHRPSQATLERLEQRTGVPLPPELRRAPAASPTHGVGPASPEVVVPVHALLGGPRVPAMPPGGWYYRNEEPSEWTRRLPGLERRPRVLAMRMPDSTMAPWRRPNELLFVDPTWAVADGDHALLELTNRQDPNGPSLFLVRRFLRRDQRASLVMVQRWEGGQAIEDALPAEQVVRLQRILEWPEITAT